MGKLMRNSNSILVLLSGGIDSTALLEYYLSKKYEVSALFFDYGQPSCKKESQVAQEICRHYEIDLIEAKMGFPLKNNNGEFVGRNALFIVVALSFLPSNYSKIAIGIHTGTSYYDCSQTFVEDCQRLIDGYFSGTVLLEVPFLQYSKEQIIDYCIQKSIPISLTYSCELGHEGNCGKCLSCKDRRRFLSE
ncbi:7-cyano-7-deazaguanine synthase [Gottfriedia acidiceleris]|uniref:7-cyano-7-deazaguanine synthase n=1 Tax=Gottfriedia acidiceleris TaxID=371036 RepID=A0ABY4JPB3_9BACI|nr:7-cyano-7-deazaguanine synthase [Gottfriedia acidiceleris]UPM54527.1 7-cyano-7-deazaguanine synthase [Gottfriedia acidiceleris]